MKKLTYSSMAAARLRANKRQYASLMVGIFLSIFLISTLVLSVWGIYQAQLQKKYDSVGYLDIVILDNENTDIVTEEAILKTGDYDRLGHAYVSGVVTGKNVYVGYYDGAGTDLLNLFAVEGRMPENSGEIALEQSAMDILEATWNVGETVELAITPIDGVEETRQYTLVGILPERTNHLKKIDHNGIGQFPGIITSTAEPAFTTGRLAYHYVLGLGKDGTISKALKGFWDRYENYSVVANIFGISITGEQVWWYGTGDFISSNREMFMLIFMVCVLAGSLILSCCIGISGAMEGVLSKRREEIGVLRALGATKRQIRRMFGRENLLLALFVSPLSILISMGTVWVLSLLIPTNLKFNVNLWLIMPIALLSVIVILISGYLPLTRASKLMPMSVIRDTVMLRRSKGVKSKKEFSATRLMASRQVRFNPTRQIGASLLVGLMLLCSGILTVLATQLHDYATSETPGFSIENSYYGNRINGIPCYDKESLNKQSIQQLKSLDYVDYICINREMPVFVQLDKVPRYAMTTYGEDQFGMLDDTLYAEATEWRYDREIYEQYRQQDREGYLQLKKDYGFQNEAFQISIITVDLSDENMTKLKAHLTDGTIDVDAINAGAQVLVYTPEVWVKTYDNGSIMTIKSDAPQFEQEKNGAWKFAWNDSFEVGQILSTTQLYSIDDTYTTIKRHDAQVQICGLVDSLYDLDFYSWNVCAIITTEQGLENMALRAEGLREVDLYLDGEISLEAEERLERQINAIANRAQGVYVQNWVAKYRESEQADKQTLLLCVSIVTVFFAAAVGMIVSSVTRQLNNEGRTIGMLRAVGADANTILGCYSGQLNASIIGGLFISLGLIGLYCLAVVIDGLRYNYFMSIQDFMICMMSSAIISIMAFFCYVICKYLLRLRIHEIINKSIIDNIREL